MSAVNPIFMASPWHKGLEENLSVKEKEMLLVSWCAQETFVGRARVRVPVRAQELGASTWSNKQGMQEQQQPRF